MMKCLYCDYKTGQMKKHIWAAHRYEYKIWQLDIKTILYLLLSEIGHRSIDLASRIV